MDEAAGSVALLVFTGLLAAEFVCDLHRHPKYKLRKAVRRFWQEADDATPQAESLDMQSNLSKWM